MKKVLKELEWFFTSVTIVIVNLISFVGIFYSGDAVFVDYPKKKNYIKRSVLTFFGIAVISLIVGFFIHSLNFFL